MHRYFRKLLCTLVVSVSLSSCSAIPALNLPSRESTSTNLVPYSNPPLGFISVVPRGWVEDKPGQFLRDPHHDPAILSLAFLKDLTLELAAADWRLPSCSGTIVSPDLTWERYSGDLEWPLVALGDPL